MSGTGSSPLSSHGGWGALTTPVDPVHKGIELLTCTREPRESSSGSARMTQQSRDVSDRLMRNEEIERKQRELNSKKLVMENEIALLRAKFAREEDEMKTAIGQDVYREKAATTAMKEISVQRKADR